MNVIFHYKDSDVELAKFLNYYLDYLHDYCLAGHICMLLEITG